MADYSGFPALLLSLADGRTVPVAEIGTNPRYPSLAAPVRWLDPTRLYVDDDANRPNAGHALALYCTGTFDGVSPRQRNLPLSSLAAGFTARTHLRAVFFSGAGA
jgi:hypothetical protein